MMERFFLKKFLKAYGLYILISVYAFIFTVITAIKYYTFAYQDFDLSEQAQSVWNILHGSIGCSILEIPFLGNHMRLILFLIAPFYFIFRSPYFLLFLQTVFLGGSAYPLYLIARKYLNEKFSLLVVFLYLIYPALGFINLYEFHAEALSIPFLFLMIYFFETERFKRFLLALFLALSCKENIALVVTMFGFLAIVHKRDRYWIFIPIIIGSTYFLSSVLLIMPALNQGQVGFHTLYRHLGKNIFEIAQTIGKHPIASFGETAGKQDLVLLLQLMAPVGGIIVLRPAYLMLALPIILQHLLSLRPTEHSIFYHYTAPLIPFIFAACVHSFAWINEKMTSLKAKKIVLGAVVAIAVTSSITIGPLFRILPFLHNRLTQEINREKRKLLSLVPPHASVVASFEFLPFLSHRKNLFSFHYIVSGRYTISEKQYVFPAEAEYALINFDDYLINTVFFKQDSLKRIQSFLKEYRLKVVDSCGGVVLFKNNQEGQDLYEIVPAYQGTGKSTIDNSLELLEFSADKQTVRRKEKVNYTFIFKCKKETNKRFRLFLNFLFLGESKSKIYYNVVIPLCQGMYPTDEWKQGEIVKGYYTLLFPRTVHLGSYQVTGGLLNQATNTVTFLKDRQGKPVTLGTIDIIDS